MKRLNELQVMFQNYVLNGNPDIKSFVSVPLTESIDQRLNIYRSSCAERLVDQLSKNYSIFKAYIGNALFVELAYTYIKDSPSVYPYIKLYDGGFYEFLKQTELGIAKPYLPELALFDWSMILVSDAADADKIPAHSLDLMTPENFTQMTFLFHPSVLRLDLEWNSPKIWEELSRNLVPQEPMKLGRKVSWLLWREGPQNQFICLPSPENLLIDSMLKGVTVADLIGDLSSHMSEVQAQLKIRSLLSKLMAAGIVTGLTTTSSLST